MVGIKDLTTSLVHRSLYETYNDPGSMSNRCKSKCVEENKNFCPNSNYSGGYCCDDGENCPRADVCSNDNPRAPIAFKLLACPNEDACEGKIINPKYNGEKLTRAVDKYTYQMVKNDVCGYIVNTPEEMQVLD